MNQVNLAGFITRDGVKTRQAGSWTIFSFSMAVSEFRGQNKERETHYIDIETFNPQASNLQPDTKVFVVGKLKQDKWQDKQTGQNRSKLKVMADEVGTCGRQPNRANGTGQNQQQAAQNFQPQPAGSAAPPSDIPF